MRALILAFLLFLTIFAVAQSDEKCISPKGPTYYQVGWVLVKKEIKAFRHIEMWGASDHSPREFTEAGKKFKFHWIETKGPKTRYIHEVRKGVITFKCGSNNDTGPDHLRVMAGGEILLDTDFGEKAETFKLNLNFNEGTSVIVMVYNKCMPNQSPGAFFVGANLIYAKQVYRRQKALISITL